MGGWNLPDDVSDNDPRAPWNEPSHDERCPQHEDYEPDCSECGEKMDEGRCWVYEFWPFYGGGSSRWDRLCQYVARRPWVAGLFPQYCNEVKDPDCKCEDFYEEPDYERED